MIRPFARLCLAALLVSLIAVSAQAQEWGTLKGKFVYDGPAPKAEPIVPTKDQDVCGKHPLVDESLLVDANGGVANVALWVITKGVAVAPSYKPDSGKKLVYDNKGCRFEPHVLALWITEGLELHNSDPIGHNSNLQPLGGEPINPLLPPGGVADYKFAKAPRLPTPITCNIHPWMNGWVIARDNPYVAVSKPDGTFEIKDLPAGELEFLAWHERPGYLNARDWVKGKFKLTIKSGDNDLGEIKLSPDLLKKKS